MTTTTDQRDPTDPLGRFAGLAEADRREMQRAASFDTLVRHWAQSYAANGRVMTDADILPQIAAAEAELCAETDKRSARSARLSGRVRALQTELERRGGRR